jgi:hypothetical protein
VRTFVSQKLGNVVLLVAADPDSKADNRMIFFFSPASCTAASRSRERLRSGFQLIHAGTLGDTNK